MSSRRLGPPDPERFFAELVAGMRAGGGDSARAPIDIYLTDDPPTLTAELDVAGLEPASLEVEIEGDLLTVSGVRRRRAEGRRRYQHAEIEWGPFRRCLRLTRAVDPQRATADYRDGLLRVRLPLAERVPGGRVLVAIRVAG